MKGKFPLSKYHQSLTSSTAAFPTSVGPASISNTCFVGKYSESLAAMTQPAAPPVNESAFISRGIEMNRGRKRIFTANDDEVWLISRGESCSHIAIIDKNC